MKPLISEIEDTATLLELGRASVQIVHDLKNQLNGLKLYATFLRKRMEKAERPADEQETLAKLIAGIERAAADMTALVRYGRPIELRRQRGVDLVKLLTNVANGEDKSGAINLTLSSETLEGEFDVTALTEAFKGITTGALNLRASGDSEALQIRLQQGEADGADGAGQALVEWRGMRFNDDTDLFHSFAGSDALRMSLAAKIIAAHGGAVIQEGETLRVRLPLN
jgi:nitrogen fixation/metabolism regulation signal transduction histidine kinase